MIVVCQNIGYMSTLVDDISLSEKAVIRRKWRLERERWELDKVRHQDDMNVWERERREREGEREKHEKDKEEWERQQREEREAFDREKEEWARQRWEEEKHRKDVEWRRRGAFWSEPWAAAWQCSGYGTRAYAAHLWDLPGDVNWHEACMDMPIKIKGQWMDRPAKCQKDVSVFCFVRCDQELTEWQKYHIWGTWYVNFGEPQCVPYWDPIRDMVNPKPCRALLEVSLT